MEMKMLRYYRPYISHVCMDNFGTLTSLTTLMNDLLPVATHINKYGRKNGRQCLQKQHNVINILTKHVKCVKAA